MESILRDRCLWSGGRGRLKVGELAAGSWPPGSGHLGPPQTRKAASLRRNSGATEPSASVSVQLAGESGCRLGNQAELARACQPVGAPGLGGGMRPPKLA